MPSFSAIVHKKRKKGNENSKIGWKVLQLPYTACSYNFKNMSMCSYNFNVAVRISINLSGLFFMQEYIIGMIVDTS